MSERDVVDFLDLCSAHSVAVWIDGGWGVDALLGEQTRRHEDLDIALRHADVPKLRALLEARGYRDVPRDDTRDCNFVLGDAHGRLVDFHSFAFDDEGNRVFGVEYPLASLSGRGSIGGRPVQCIAAEWLMSFHTGYPPDEGDLHDVLALHERFDLAIPLVTTSFCACAAHPRDGGLASELRGRRGDRARPQAASATGRPRRRRPRAARPG